MPEFSRVYAVPPYLVPVQPCLDWNVYALGSDGDVRNLSKLKTDACFDPLAQMKHIVKVPNSNASACSFNMIDHICRMGPRNPYNPDLQILKRLLSTLDVSGVRQS